MMSNLVSFLLLFCVVPMHLKSSICIELKYLSAFSYCVKLMRHSIVSLLLDCAHCSKLRPENHLDCGDNEKKRDLMSVLVEKLKLTITLWKLLRQTSRSTQVLSTQTSDNCFFYVVKGLSKRILFVF